MNSERSIWATEPPRTHQSATPADAARRHYVRRACRYSGHLGAGETPEGVKCKGGSTRKKWN